MKDDVKYTYNRNTIREEDRKVVISAVITSFIIFGFITFGMYKYIVYLNDNKLIEVPDLHAELYEESADKYAEQFEIVSVDEQISNVYEVGSILSQNITAGTLVSKGTKIEVITSSNPNNLQMPELEARTLADAKKTLEKYNVTIETVLQESKIIEAGYIITTEPSFDEKLTLGQTVTLYISTGSTEEEDDETDDEDTDEDDKDTDEDSEDKDENDDEKDGELLPNFVGLTEAEARTKVKELGIKIGKIEYQNGASSTKGTISWQSVKKETLLSKVDSINFLIVLKNENANNNTQIPTTPKNTNSNDISEENISDNDSYEVKTKLIAVDVAPDYELTGSTYNVQIVLQDSTGTRAIYYKTHEVGDFPFTKKFNVEIGSMIAVYINDKLLKEEYVK